MDAKTLQTIANQRRADAITMIHRAGTGHTGGSMSSRDILTVLYYDVLNVRPREPRWPDRDRFLLSKGHSVEGYLAVLADRGFIEKSELRTFSQEGSRLIGHPNNAVPGVEVCTGALGHGLPVGVGSALAAKRLTQPYRVFVLMGDGEQAEGSVWEAAMAAANFKLDNLFAVIDRNGLQISGDTESVMALENFRAKWEAFGWDVAEADGNDPAALQVYFHGAHPEGKPHCLIAHTVKGKGLPFAENRKEWHHKVPTAEQLAEGYAALGVQGVDWA
ncbi:MAG: transketolase [Candidatus Limiplasma sp.]|nr:transketolase [Candidatus Limiplasma sp.]